MKKIASVFCVFLFIFAGAVSQEANEPVSDAADTAVAEESAGPAESKQPNNQIEVITETEKSYTMTIEYIPYTDEARFIYTCPSSLFEQGKAMNTIKERAVDFTKEREYFFYTYTRPDMTRYDNANKIVSYTSYIKFLR